MRLAWTIVGGVVVASAASLAPRNVVASSQAGSPAESRQAAAGFEALFIHDACIADNAEQPDTCLHERRHERAFIFGGRPGSVYDVTLRIRGLFEPTTVAGGEVPDAAHPYFVAGGQSRTADYSRWHIDVSEPAQSYTLNHRPSVSHTIYKEDFEATIPVTGGARVLVQTIDSNDREIDNGAKGRPHRQQILEGVVDTPQPGQMLRIDVVRVTVRQPSSGPQVLPAPGPQLLHPLFQDHAVLQRDRPISVYGEGTPGAVVRISLGSANAEARVASDGHWKATLPAMTAGGPYTLSATANGETRSASDVLVGDVFLCAGQSNMAFTQRQADGAAEDALTATDSRIRHLTVPPDASVTPRQGFARSVRWVVASPETVGSFSAACYYFGRELKKTVSVPIGLVNASYGGARLRTFMSEAALRKLGAENNALDLLDLYRTDPAAAMRRWGAEWESAWGKGRPHDGRPWLPAYDDSPWKIAPAALGAWALWNGTNPDGFIGQVWLRTTVTLTAAQAANADASLDLGSVNQEDETWLNGSYLGASSFARRTRYAIAPGLLKAGVNVIVTNVYCGWRDCGMRGAAEDRAIRFGDGTSVPIAGRWKYQEVSDGWIGPQLPWGPVHGITLDHNGMILPVGPYSFRGAVWYQGESDVNHAGNYTRSLLAMMADWRRQFDDRQLPFLLVQLPGYGPAPTDPTAAPWADLREAQRQTALADARTALAVTLDIGDPANLHPTNKREVGRRLAIAARHLIYGERIAPSGPVVVGALRRGSSVVVSFRDVTGALTLRTASPRAFELCGAVQASCRWVNARIDGGASVVLPDARSATRVRYAWGGSPACPLGDGSGLPAGPFEVPIRVNATAR
jgi:sialate O-acetylesterase